MDLRGRVPPEPPAGTLGVLQTRIRFPDGTRTNRQFMLSDPIQTIHSFIGAHESINPCNFRVLLSDGPVPSEMARSDDSISQLGLTNFIVLIGENRTGDEDGTPPPLSDNEQATNEATENSTNDAVMEVGAEIEVIDLTVDTAASRPVSLSDLDDHWSKLRSNLLSNGVYNMCVERDNVLNDVINAYSNVSLLHRQEVRVRFVRERGVDGGGLRRELTNCFWSQYSVLMDGALDHIPLVLPSNYTSFHHIGRFISHWYLMTGYFPITISLVATKMILCGVNSVSDEELVSSFSRLIDPFESTSLKCVNDQCLANIITPTLSRFNVHAIPTENNLPALFKQAARYALITKPFFALYEIRRGMLAAHPTLWRRFGNNPHLVEAMYDVLRPSVTRVLAMLVEPNTRNAQQDATFDFLRRLIHSLSCKLLGNLLAFTTGFALIMVQFNELKGSARRPMANTCAAILYLSTTYESYTAFEKEFTAHLKRPDLWTFVTGSRKTRHNAAIFKYEIYT